MSFSRSDFPYFLRGYYYDVPGLVAFTYPNPQAFIANIKNVWFPEIQAFIVAAIAVSLISLLLRSLIS